MHAGTFFVSLFSLVREMRFPKSCLAIIFFLSGEAGRHLLHMRTSASKLGVGVLAECP